MLSPASAAAAFPVSTFFATTQKIVSQASDLAPGTVTVGIATTGQPTGYATNTSSAPATSGVACVVDQSNVTLPSNYEMANYTTVDATHFQMTLKKPHNMPATIAIGGLCGYGLEQTVDTTAGIRQVFPVVGSNSATSLYYAGTASANVGQMGSTSAFVNVSLPITSLARSGNLVTLTTSSPLPFDLNGLPLSIAGVADSSYNGTFTATSTGASTLTYTQSGANSTSTGGTASLRTGGFALYPMAEVLSVFDTAAKTVDGAMTLAPNTVAWASGDAVEEPHFFQESVGADITYVTQTTPRPNTYTRAGITYQGNNGPGLQGWSIANSTPAANYIGNGGTHTAPDFAYQVSGIWNRAMVLQAGEQSVFTVNCNSHGCGRWNSPLQPLRAAKHRRKRHPPVAAWIEHTGLKPAGSPLQLFPFRLDCGHDQQHHDQRDNTQRRAEREQPYGREHCGGTSSSLRPERCRPRCRRRAGPGRDCRIHSLSTRGRHLGYSRR